MSATNVFLKSDVLDAATKEIARIERRRVELDTEHLMKNYLTYRKYGFFGPWLTRTFEEAREARDSSGNDWKDTSWFQSLWCDDLATAEYCIRLCKMSPFEHVNLTRQEFEAIGMGEW
jgi:hypothetical protein